MAKVTLKDRENKPTKFNKNVVLELSPAEAVALKSILGNSTYHIYKSGIYNALTDAGVPSIIKHAELFKYGTAGRVFNDSFTEMVEEVAKVD